MSKQQMYISNLHAVGELVYEKKDIPECLEDEVLVKIKNCGICGSDIARVLKTGTYHFPTIPGHEFSGEVVLDKSGKYKGKRVAVFPVIPCRMCDMCKKGNYAQCIDYDYYGSRCDGAFAEYISVKKKNIIEIPDNVSFEEAAMCEPASVALHAIKKLKIKNDDHILITGAGPIGIMAGIWAKSKGASKVSYIDIDKRKIEFAESFGFSEYDGSSIDKVLEGTGASSALEKAIKSINPFGKIVLMGNPSKTVDLSSEIYQKILRKELTIYGTWNSSFSEKENDWKETLMALSEKKLDIKRIITHRTTLENCLNAIKMMDEHKEFYCKIMIENERSEQNEK